jgi:hypothetical protein
MATSFEGFEPLYAASIVSPEIFVRAQEELRRIIEQFTKIELLDGLRITDQSITSGSTNLINHTLGRKYEGWIITNVDSACTIHLDEASTADPAFYLPLVTSANCTADFWVF